MDSQKKTLNIHDVAKRLGVSHHTIRHWLRAGRFIRPLPFSRALLWDAQAFERWIDRQMEAANNAAS
jgi:predicted DNA-binding transcriptional regulator AlpA